MEDPKLKVEFCSSEQAIEMWKDLWPHQNKRLISSMTLDGEYDLGIYKRYKPFFWYLSQNNRPIGILSGHNSSDDQFRFRGLFIQPEYRGRNYSQLLFRFGEDVARRQGAVTVWSFPKKIAIHAYTKNGFEIVRETENNFYVEKLIRSGAWNEV